MPGVTAATPFPAPPKPAPPHSESWQRDVPPHNVLTVDDGTPGPVGFHFITDGDAHDALYRKDHGLEPLVYGSPLYGPKAPKIDPKTGLPIPGSGQVTPPAAVSSPLRPVSPPPERVCRPPRAPRDSRDPRAPRPQRPSRQTRPDRGPRAPRDPRTPRPPRKPRPPRDRRRDRFPKQPKTVGAEFDYYCGVDIETGASRHSGGPLQVPRGQPPPEAGPGSVLVQVEGGTQCGAPACNGPLSPFLRGLFDILPNAWRPVVDPKLLAKIAESNHNRRIRYQARQRAPRQPKNRGPYASSGYCCICGTTGFCFQSGQDCRLLPVMQRSKGQC